MPLAISSVAHSEILALDGGEKWQNTKVAN